MLTENTTVDSASARACMLAPQTVAHCGTVKLVSRRCLPACLLVFDGCHSHAGLGHSLGPSPTEESASSSSARLRAASAAFSTS